MGVPLKPPQLVNGLMKPFYEALRQEKLCLPYCSVCAKRWWYPPEVVPCHPKGHLVWEGVSSTGVIYTHTTVHVSLLPGDDQSATPYRIVLVEPDDAPGARIASVWVAPDGREPECGARVKLRTVPSGDCMLPGFTPLD